MTGAGFFQLALLCVVLVVTVIPLGRYMAAVYGGGTAPGGRFFDPIERVIYRILRVDPRREQRWNVYTIALLAFSVLSFLFVYGLQRFQDALFFNPTNMVAVPFAANPAVL